MSIPTVKGAIPQADLFKKTSQSAKMDLTAPSKMPASAGKPAVRPPLLDERLRAAADWVAPCETCADIGCDHGRFGAALLLEQRCRRLLAADVSAKALEKARLRLTSLGLSDQTTFAVANGLDAIHSLPNQHADTVCILGMGGDTVAGILERGNAYLYNATLVLGAQTELFLVRAVLQQIGYAITDERVVCAAGRQYILMRATPAPADFPPYSERELLLGPMLLAHYPAEWKPWLLRKHKLLSEALSAMKQAASQQPERMERTAMELQYTAEALQAYH